MKRVVASALLLLLCSACASPREPAPAPPPPARQETPQPPPALPTATRHSEADDVLTFLQGRTAQQAIVDAGAVFPPGCVRLSQAPRDELLLVTTRCREGEHPYYLAWKVRTGWRISALHIGEAPIDRFVRIVLVTAAGAPDVLILGETREGGMSLVRAWREGTGELITQAVTRSYPGARFDFLSPALVLVDYAAGGQALIEWDGTRFADRAERTRSTPESTATQLIAALKAGDRTTAAAFLDGPGLMDRLVSLLQLGRTEWRGGAQQPVPEVGRLDWEALPEPYRQTLAAPASYSFRLESAGGALLLEMTYRDRRWLVTDLHRP